MFLQLYIADYKTEPRVREYLCAIPTGGPASRLHDVTVNLAFEHRATLQCSKILSTGLKKRGRRYKSGIHRCCRNCWRSSTVM